MQGWPSLAVGFEAGPIRSQTVDLFSSGWCFSCCTHDDSTQQASVKPTRRPGSCRRPLLLFLLLPASIVSALFPPTFVFAVSRAFVPSSVWTS